jgi:hypothetical protein
MVSASTPALVNNQGHDGVRVPHLTRATFVPSPHKRWHGGHELDNPRRLSRVLGHPHRPPDGVRKVRDDAISPPPNLISEETKASRKPRPDRSLDRHAALDAPTVDDRGLLDHESALGKLRDERRMVEVIPRSPLDPSGDGLEQLAAQPDDMRARAERNPIQVDVGKRIGVLRLGAVSSLHAG